MSDRRIFTFKNKRHMPKWLAWILAGVLKLYSCTLRFRITGEERVVSEMLSGKPVVLALWHNRVIGAVTMIPRKILSRCVVMISASRDGEYISTVVGCLGLESVRGSSSRKGIPALLGLVRALKAGKSPVLTLDGPRGPRYAVHPGAAGLARSAKASLVPIALNATRCWQLHSWDKMQIPCPFCRVDLVVGTPIDCGDGRSEEELTDALRRGMEGVTRDPGDGVCGR